MDKVHGPKIRQSGKYQVYNSSFDHDLEDPVPFQQQIVDALYHLPHAKSNSAELYPLIKRVSRAMDINNLKLDYMQLFIDADNQLELLEFTNAARTLQTSNITKCKDRLYDILKVDVQLLISIFKIGLFEKIRI
jgi:hypothetical protein